ncbi:universal stress protein [Alteromonas sp. ASW11-36]|uniref:Universal stress protein n=1 Tax=Alteromonas arenosi TaxID=3055817 RepID=A0ABT7T0E4_9ALTE|nr:universal stress protein [Alteromonas sp. ASW11-36]MDM7861886.1 universal stress protein [Alteromonas sp. ASW11-36]
MSCFKHVLCVLTELQNPDEVVGHAIHICQQHNAKLTVMLALEPLPPNANMVMESFAYIDTYESIQAAAEQRLDSKAQEWREKMPVDTVFRYGHSFIEIAKVTQDIGADLVVKLAKTDLIDRLFGHEDMRLLRKCPAPVWLLHRNDSQRYQQIVAAVDVNYHYPDDEVATRKQLNQAVVIKAAQVAVEENATLNIVHVIDEQVDMVVYDGIVDMGAHAFGGDQEQTEAERQAAIQELIELIKGANPDDVIENLRIQTHVIRGNARRDMPELISQLDCDLLVMGTVARIGIPGFFMGNTAESVLNQVNCSVLALKPAGFSSPLIT